MGVCVCVRGGSVEDKMQEYVGRSDPRKEEERKTKKYPGNSTRFYLVTAEDTQKESTFLLFETWVCQTASAACKILTEANG